MLVWEVKSGERFLRKNVPGGGVNALLGHSWSPCEVCCSFLSASGIQCTAAGNYDMLLNFQSHRLFI